MSYYIKDSNNNVYCSGVAGLEDKPIKALYRTEVVTTKDIGLEPIYTFSDTRGTPIIALKDGSKPVYDGGVALNTFHGMPNGQQPQAHVFMAMASFSSSNEQYNFKCNEDSPYPILYYPYASNKNISIKELYVKGKPVVNYVNPDKGNLLSWSIKPDNINWIYDYNKSTSGPYAPSAYNILRNHMAWYNPSDTATCNNYPSNEIGVGFSQYAQVRFSPLKYNNKFGYTEHILNASDLSGETLSYYTLSINDIRNNYNYTKLKLKYYYTVHFDGEYENGIMTKPTNVPDDWNNNLSTGTYKNPFFFDYYLSDEDTWDLVDDGTSLLILGTNLTSTLENNIDTHSYYITNRYNEKLDKWNDIETLKRLYIGYINTGDYDLSYVKFTNFKGAYYIYNSTGTTSPYTASVSNWSETNHYNAGSVVKYNNKYYVYNWSDYSNENPESSPLNNAAARWIKVDIEDYKPNFSNVFGNSGHFLSTNVDSWKNISGNILPYVRCWNKNCYLDDYYSGSGPKASLGLTSYPIRSTDVDLVYNLWSNYCYSSMNFDPNQCYNTSQYFNFGYYKRKFKKNYSGVFAGSLTYKDCIIFDGTVGIAGYYLYDAAGSNRTKIATDTLELVNNDTYVSKEYYDTFNKNNSYKKGDIVRYNDNNYQALTDIPAGREITSNIWVDSGYSIYGITGDTNPELKDIRDYKNYMCVGSASYTIDLTNVNKKYIHISFPPTMLLNTSVYQNGSARIFITDLKMTYEGLE
jgi:hypothetical protein